MNLQEIKEELSRFVDWYAEDKKTNTDLQSKINKVFDYIVTKEIELSDGRKEGFDAGYKKATERAYERQQDLTDTYIRDGEKIRKLGEENAELKAQYEKEHSLLNDIIESFTSQSLTDDFEMADTAREIAEILGIKNYR